jgi:glutamate formiminotransferase
MDVHEGEHPRIGAVDVIPFIPLGDTTIDACIELARDFGERIAARFEIPVYLYARAATRPERVKLADVRRGQYEGLRAEIGQRGREPDFGPSHLHRSAGAVAVGARPFLIAYNINLDSADVDLAKRIARRVRESGGGLPRLQANGFEVREPERGHPLRAQVSMNLLDFTVTPLWLVWDTVRDLAAQDGVELAESELIGLAPLASFLAVADRAEADPALPVEERLRAAADYLRLRDFSPMQALELRLEEARRGVPSSSSGSPATGERDPRRTGA